MRVNKIQLENFRNYENEEAEFKSERIIIHGSNAQGKSNMLEGIYMFSLGRSDRTIRDSEVIKFGSDSARTRIDFIANDRENHAEIEISNKKRKSICYNDILLKKSSEMIGKFRVIYFDPDYLKLVKGGPKIRRNNLDMFISQLRPNYFSFLSMMKKIIESKNALLKSNSPSGAMLDILNEKLAENAAQVIVYRNEYIKKTESVSREIQSDISGGKEKLEVIYTSCIGEADGLNKDEIKEKLCEKLESGKKREIENREACIGPHRDEISYLICGKDVRIYGSQGQKKTTSLVQKLSEAELIKSEAGEYPVLLLDDIMSELDNERQDYILNQLKKTQIFITCTDPSRFKNMKEAQFLKIENGKINTEER